MAPSPRDKNSVLTGAGTLYAAECIGGTFIAFPANPGATPAVDWIDLGYTDAGVAIELDRTFEDIEVEEEFDALDVVQTAQTFRVVAALAENTLTNIRRVMGGTYTAGSPAGYDTWVAPTGGTTPLIWSLLFRALAPKTSGITYYRDWQFKHCIATGAVSIQHKKAPQKRLLAVEFRVVKPATGNTVTIIDDVA